MATKTTKPKRKNFSSFNTKEAFKQLNLDELTPWSFTVTPIPVSKFFQERLDRLQRHFDLDSCEESQKLLIDAVCDEALENLDRLKIWKGANLETDTTCGVADYLIAERKRYLEHPFLCIIEAKRDDFEQGLAQCLVEMQACQWETRQDQPNLDRDFNIFGIVTNGNTWQFYKLTPKGKVHETPAYSIGDLELLLGRLHHVFQLCEQNLSPKH
ncbi:MAG: hypothetical protein VKJ24_19790 [Synechococcales bacterium]|nr:hypothetical protein [Synechococcales bacterium]